MTFVRIRLVEPSVMAGIAKEERPTLRIGDLEKRRCEKPSASGEA